MKTFWLSFAAEDGSGRVVLVDAESAQEASAAGAVWAKPGDELLVIEIPPETEEFGLPRDRELTEEEIRGVGAVQMDVAAEQGLRPIWETE
jgi:hypothetical protein